jgi:tRNA G18 (ribose-2'-O)-methylase SpoU
VPEEVTDPADPRLADFRDLTVADRRPDRTGGRGLVIAEGVPVVRRLLASPYPVRAVLGVPGRLAALAADLAAVDAPVYQASAEVMAETVGFHLNRGVLAAADRAPEPVAGAVLAGARRVLALEGVNDHENLGALFRNAAALGVDAVLLGPRCADPLYRRSVRVSMGHVLRVPFVRAPLSALREAGLTVLALTPRPPAAPLSTVDPSVPRAALLVGAEGAGLSAAALAVADRQVRIPMAAGVDSLNVATAAAIALHHLTTVDQADPAVSGLHELAGDLEIGDVSADRQQER